MKCTELAPHRQKIWVSESLEPTALSQFWLGARRATDAAIESVKLVLRASTHCAFTSRLVHDLLFTFFFRDLVDATHEDFS